MSSPSPGVTTESALGDPKSPSDPTDPSEPSAPITDPALAHTMDYSGRAVALTALFVRSPANRLDYPPTVPATSKPSALISVAADVRRLTSIPRADHSNHRRVSPITGRCERISASMKVAPLPLHWHFHR